MDKEEKKWTKNNSDCVAEWRDWEAGYGGLGGFPLWELVYRVCSGWGSGTNMGTWQIQHI